MVKKKESEQKVEKIYMEGVVEAKKMKPDLRKKEPPLVDVKVTNPLTYIKSWWKKIIGNEGVDMRIRVKPLTAIAISIIVLTITLGIGKFVFPFKVPFFVYTTENKSTPVSDDNGYRNTAFTGTLRHTLLSNRYYLITSTSEAINLELPDNIDLKGFVGRRIFATGKYHDESRTLLITDTKNLELLPEDAQVIPTVEATTTPEPTVVPTAAPKNTPLPTEAPTP